MGELIGYLTFLVVGIASYYYGYKNWKDGKRVYSILLFTVGTLIFLGFLGMALGSQDGSIS